MPGARPSTAKPIVSAAKLWRSLCKEGGLQLAWDNGKPLPSYDRALESDISRALFGDDRKSLTAQLEGGGVSTATLLNAFFAALQPFSQMLHDIYAMLDTANASTQDKTLRVSLKPESLDQPLLATLQQFREWEEKLRTASIRVVVPVWTNNSLWSLRQAFADEPETFGAWPYEPWDEAYRKAAGFPSPPRFEPTGESAFDASAATAYEAVDWFVQSCRRLAPDHAALARRFHEAGGYGRTDDGSDPAFELLRVLASAEADFWPVGMVSQIRKARNLLLGLSAAARTVEAARISDNVTRLIGGLPKSQTVVDGFEKVLRDIFRLPVWKERSAVYSVWISTQIVAALAPRRITFHPDRGQLNFGFAGSRLATIETVGGDFALWSELRTSLQRTASLYRKHSIQPDYRIVAPGNEKDPASTCLVVECKQYKKASTRNFTEAVNDYAVSCPNAVVALVNYGPIGTGLNAHVEPTVQGRVSFIESFKPASNLGQLKGLVDRAVPGIVTAKVSWPEPGSVTLSWNAPLQDLDLHAHVALDGGVHEISFRRKIDALANVELSQDIQSGPGQERLRIQSWKAVRYDIYVHNYSGSPSLAGAEAWVHVRIGDQNWEFSAPIDGGGLWWHVCTIAPENQSVTPVGHLLAQVTL